jgi:hypothetical protein
MSRTFGSEPDRNAPDHMSRRGFVRYIGAVVVIAGCGDDSDGAMVVPGSTASPIDPSTTLTPNVPPSSEGDPSIAEGPPPTLAITFPPDDAWLCGTPIDGGTSRVPLCIVDGPMVTFEGTVTDGAAVFAGDAPADVVDGQWLVDIRIDEGTHVYTVVARDGVGREASASVSVFYEKRENSDH